MRSHRDNDAGPKLDEEFYRDKSWGSIPIRQSRDLPSLKLRHLLAELSGRNRRDASLLEVGCGSGRILSSLHERIPELELTGIDLSPQQIEIAARAHPKIQFACGNGEALPFASESFDYVIFFDYLEHIENPAQSMAEMLRVLRPGGMLHFVCPAEKQSIYALSSAVFRRHFKKSTAGHIQQFSRRELTTLVNQTGFQITRTQFSYHLLGSLMDYTLFTLMLHPRMYQIYWTSNQYYAVDRRRPKPGIFNLLLRTGNAIAYFESRVLARCALTATAMHVSARKRTPAHAART